MQLQLNLNASMNHKSIGIKENIRNIDLKYGFGKNWLIEPEMMQKFNSVTNIEGIDFLLPEISDNKPDNVVCENQIVIIEKGFYRYISLLGFSEWSDHQDDLILEFTDGTSENIKLHFYEIVKRGLGSGKVFKYDFIDNNCTLGFEVKSKIHSMSFFISVFRMNIENGNRILAQLKLPDNNFIHIYSISLESV